MNGGKRSSPPPAITCRRLVMRAQSTGCSVTPSSASGDETKRNPPSSRGRRLRNPIGTPEWRRNFVTRPPRSDPQKKAEVRHGSPDLSTVLASQSPGKERKCRKKAPVVESTVKVPRKKSSERCTN